MSVANSSPSTLPALRVQPMAVQPVDPALAEAIAARYGVAVAPGAVVQRLPTGVSSRPYMVWDGAKNQLTVPDAQSWREQSRSAAVRSGIARAKASRAKDQGKIDRLRQMHADGLRVPAMAAALGISDAYCRAMLSRLGLRMERVNPGPSPDTLHRMAEVERLVAQGRSRAAIAEALGFADTKYLVGFVRRSLPGLILPPEANGLRKPRARAALTGPGRACTLGVKAGISAAAEAKRAERAVLIRRMLDGGAGEDAIAVALGIVNRRHLRRTILRLAGPGTVAPRATRDYTVRDNQIRGLLPDHAMTAIAAMMDLTLGQVAASVKRMRAQGVLPGAAGAMPRRRASAGRAGRIVNAARNADILARHHAGDTVEAIIAATGLSRDIIKSVVRRAGDSIRNNRTSLPRQRLAELPDLVARGMSGQEIADHWGCKVSAVYGMASKAGISLNGTRRAHNTGTVTPKVASRRKWIAAMIRQGKTHAEMLAVLDIHHSTLSADIKAAGLSGQSLNSKGGVKRRDDAERRAA